MIDTDGKLTRIAVFYDGNYFSHVSNYYNYQHQRHARIDFSGLHAFIRNRVASLEDVEPRYAQIVDAHYFRGRKSARDANLVAERQFDEVLMRANITTHYTPLTRFGEKGIDVWLALEAFELVILKRYNVVALIAGDADYLPLLRKLATFGTRVMLLGWQFKYLGPDGSDRETRTAQSLLDEATYPVLMSDIMNEPSPADASDADALFVKRSPPFVSLAGEGDADQQADARSRPFGAGATADGGAAPGDAAGAGSPSGEPGRRFESAPVPRGDELTPFDDDAPRPASAAHGAADVEPVPSSGTVKLVRTGYGFIEERDTHQNIFFHWTDVDDVDFNELREGMPVRFVHGRNDRGACARHVAPLGFETPVEI